MHVVVQSQYYIYNIFVNFQIFMISLILVCLGKP